MNSYISCFNVKGELEHFEVAPEVALYIKQIELYIKHPTESKLLNLYSFRFVGQQGGDKQ